MPDWQIISDGLREHGIRLSGSGRPRRVGGGDIGSAWQLDTESGPVFLKTEPAGMQDRLAAEAAGLRQLAAANALRVPRVLTSFCCGNDAVLALEWLTFGRADRSTQQLLGTGLAIQHRVTAAKFGWNRDNWIGSSPQSNDRDETWPRFFRQQRLEYQLRLAAANGFGGELQDEGSHLASGLERFFQDYTPPASLLHGDLWGGNWAAVNLEPVIFDPAVYYGDRESDLAMTRLFGGFGNEFYTAYEANWPLEPGHEERLHLYQLYHVLNHLNIFGSGYHDQALRLIRRLNKA